jgi:hypothetical protein
MDIKLQHYEVLVVFKIQKSVDQKENKQNIR